MDKLILTDEQREFFRRANAKRPRVVRPCSVCGRDMPPSYETRLYCGATCRKRAARQRKRQDGAAHAAD